MKNFALSEPTLQPGTDDAVLDQAEAWLAEGRGVALATVESTWGSAPRPVGSHLVVEGGGTFAGSVSGGCIEAAVIAAALEVIEGGRPRNLEFGVSDETAWSVGLPCGGTVRVLVERLDDRPLFTALQDLRRRRCPAAVVTDAVSGAHALVTAESVSGDLRLDAEVLTNARRMLADNATGLLPPRRGDQGGCIGRPPRNTPSVSPFEGEGREGSEPASLFLRTYGSPWELLIVGAVHIAQALAPMAAMAEFAVTVIDPRSAFATAARFPATRVIVARPDQVLAEDPPGPHTAVVALTHDAKIDDPALAAALRSQAFFIGALGSRRNHARRLERLAAEGFAADQLARIAGPVGLDLGGRTPAEIAVAIVAELVGARHGRRRER